MPGFEWWFSEPRDLGHGLYHLWNPFDGPGSVLKSTINPTEGNKEKRGRWKGSGYFGAIQNVRCKRQQEDFSLFSDEKHVECKRKWDMTPQVGALGK